MQFYRFTSWLYVVVAGSLSPLAALYITLEHIELAAVWAGLLVLCLPLLIAQLYGFRRVVLERAGYDGLDRLFAWYWGLEASVFLLLLAAVALFVTDNVEPALWFGIAGVAAVFAAAFGLGIVYIRLSGALAACPDALSGLRGPLKAGFLTLGILEFISIFTFLTLPFYVVAATGVTLLMALVIEAHATGTTREYTGRDVAGTYVLASLVGVVLPGVILWTHWFR